MKNNHKRKMIAPIIITVIFVLYYSALAVLCIALPDVPLSLKIIIGVLPLIPAGIMIYVLANRIKEIRSGEEDDLSKY